MKRKKRSISDKAQAALNEAVMDWLKVYEDGNSMDGPDGAVVRCGLGFAARRFFRAERASRKER